ncbi:hypothetical protein CEK63_01795 [Xanthomonas sontii]|nr:hypothetical protein CEK63_01795 [Xanthomonas sontii]
MQYQIVPRKLWEFFLRKFASWLELRVVLLVMFPMGRCETGFFKVMKLGGVQTSKEYISRMLLSLNV